MPSSYCLENMKIVLYRTCHDTTLMEDQLLFWILSRKSFGVCKDLQDISHVQKENKTNPSHYREYRFCIITQILPTLAKMGSKLKDCPFRKLPSKNLYSVRVLWQEQYIRAQKSWCGTRQRAPEQLPGKIKTKAIQPHCLRVTINSQGGEVQ